MDSLFATVEMVFLVTVFLAAHVAAYHKSVTDFPNPFHREKLHKSLRSLAMQMKVNRDCGFDFQRLPIQKKWLVVPLLDRLDGCRGKQRVAVHKLQVLDVAVLVDNRSQYYSTLNARLLRQERINGFNPMNEQTFNHTWGNAHALHAGYHRLRLQ